MTPHLANDTDPLEILGRIRQIVERRWREFFAIFAVVALAVQVLAFFLPGTYAATAAVQMQRNRFPTPISPDRGSAPTVVASSVSEAEVNSEIAILTSAQVLESTVTEMGLDRIPESWTLWLLRLPFQLSDSVYSLVHGVEVPDQRERAIRNLRKSIAAERMKDSNTLVVTYQAGDPRFAETILDTLLKHYLLAHVAAARNSEAQRFFDDQATRLRLELTGYENELLSLKRDIRVSDLGGERAAQLTLDAELRKEAQDLTRRAGEIEQKIASFRRSLSGPAGQVQVATTSSRNDPAVQVLADQVLKLELEAVRLKSHYQPTSPLVAENQGKLEAAREALARQQRGSFANSTVSTSQTKIALETDLESALAEKAGIAERRRVLDQQLAESRDRLLQLEQRQLDANRIERHIRTTEDKYTLYLRRGEEARIDAALDRDRFSDLAIVQQATAESRPVRPTRVMTLVIGFLGGMLAAAVTCAWFEIREVGFERLAAGLLPTVSRA